MFYRNKQDVVLSVVVCGDRVQETLVMIKSAVIFSQDSTLRIVVVAEPTIIPDFEEKVGAFIEFSCYMYRTVMLHSLRIFAGRWP